MGTHRSGRAVQGAVAGALLAALAGGAAGGDLIRWRVERLIHEVHALDVHHHPPAEYVVVEEVPLARGRWLAPTKMGCRRKGRHLAMLRGMVVAGQHGVVVRGTHIVCMPDQVPANVG